jgi:hypothetical protein
MVTRYEADAMLSKGEFASSMEEATNDEEWALLHETVRVQDDVNDRLFREGTIYEHDNRDLYELDDIDPASVLGKFIREEKLARTGVRVHTTSSEAGLGLPGEQGVVQHGNESLPTDTAWPMDFEDVVDCAEPQGWTVAPIIFYLTTWVMATLYLPEADDNPHKPKS